MEEGILRGLYPLQRAEARKDTHVRLLGSGTILREVLAAVPMLEGYGVSADVYSVTSFNELRRDGLAAERQNLLHPDAPPRQSWVVEQLGGDDTPVIASSDYMKVVAEQIRPFLPPIGCSAQMVTVEAIPGRSSGTFLKWIGAGSPWPP